MAKHRRVDLTRRRRPSRRTAFMVDMNTSVVHLVPWDTEATGTGRYRAICATWIVPGSLTDPGQSDCATCHKPAIPTQRARS